jgi:hypothetical protein
VARLGLNFLPLRVIALEEDGTPAEFRVRYRLDGSLSVERRPGALTSPGGRYLLALSPALPFRRAVRTPPRKRTDIELAFEDLFPFPMSDAQFSAGRLADGYEVRAMMRDQLDRLLEDWPGAGGIIVARSNAESIGQAVHERLSSGRLADLLPQAPRLISRAPMLALFLGLLLVGEVGGAIYLWSGAISAADAEQTALLEKLRAEAGPLVERRRAIGLMNQQMDIVAKFSSENSGHALVAFNKVVTALPAGAYLDHVEFTAEQLSVAGYGKDVAAWLNTLELAMQSQDIQTLPLLDRFKVTFDLKKK